MPDHNPIRSKHGKMNKGVPSKVSIAALAWRFCLLHAGQCRSVVIVELSLTLY